jgi:hypothetical protein
MLLIGVSGTISNNTWIEIIHYKISMFMAFGAV